MEMVYRSFTSFLHPGKKFNAGISKEGVYLYIMYVPCRILIGQFSELSIISPFGNLNAQPQRTTRSFNTFDIGILKLLLKLTPAPADNHLHIISIPIYFMYQNKSLVLPIYF